MKVMTILGTRPEIIRLSLIIQKLDRCADHILVHTGQNFSTRLKDIFFRELNVRSPDVYLGAVGPTLGDQLSQLLQGTYAALVKHQPDRVLILGDTNSGLTAIIAEKLGIPVYHMEAGNRCFDREVPEEVNRPLIDTVSRFNLPYTNRSRENLLREGMHPSRIITCGNPIYEVLQHFRREIARSKILKKLRLVPKKYFLLTTHRAENVDNPERLREIFNGADLIARQFKVPVVCSIHPRTKEKMAQYNVRPLERLVKLFDPFGFCDFVRLEMNARAVISDSGTVQEECCIFHVPTITVRVTTERPETIECGSNILSALRGDEILRSVKWMLTRSSEWICPDGYLDTDVSDRVISVLLSNNRECI